MRRLIPICCWRLQLFDDARTKLINTTQQTLEVGFLHGGVGVTTTQPRVGSSPAATLQGPHTNEPHKFGYKEWINDGLERFLLPATGITTHSRTHIES